MLFVSTLWTYIVIFIIALVAAFAAVMIGKTLRDRKNAKNPEDKSEKENE